MQPAPRTHTTDQQRLARLSRPAGPPRPTPVGDKARLARPVSTRPAPKPLVVSHNTWVIRGKDGTYLGFSFGDGRQSQQLDLYQYLPPARVPRLGNYVLDLTGILPDAIGIDIGGSAGLGMVSGTAGLNILWHTRGEGNRAWYPEVHVYYGYGLSKANNVSLYETVMSLDPNAAAAAQILLAWARTYDEAGIGRPAPNAWIANGFNWTGGFWSAGFSIPYPPKFTIVGSYYQSVPFYSSHKNITLWRGVSFGIGVSAKSKIKSPIKSFKLETTNFIDLKGLSVNQSKTEYGLIYGNGNDFIPAGVDRKSGKYRQKRDIGGWHLFPINQDDYN